MQSLFVGLTAFDYLAILLLGLGGILGFARGFGRQLYVSIIWLLALVLATALTGYFSLYVKHYISDDALAQQLTFIALFFLVWLAGSLIKLLAGIFVKSEDKLFLSRLFGLFLGLAQGYVAVLFLMHLIMGIPNEKYDWFDQAKMVNQSKPVDAALNREASHAQEYLKAYLPPVDEKKP